MELFSLGLVRLPLKCPYCLLEIHDRKPPAQCPRCKQPLPVLYTDEYQNRPPFFVQVFGWSRVGKTVFLSALTLILRKMGKVWSGYSFSPATEIASRKLEEINKYLANGVMPALTQPGMKDVYIMILQNMERWGSRALVTRDCAGEVFDNFQVPVEQVPYLLRAPTTMMLVSLPDMRARQDGKSVDMLVTSYINTLRANNVDFRREHRKLVVVLTKGDLLDNLPANLHNYLTSDPIWATINSPGAAFRLDGSETAKYLEKMARVSDAARDWLMDGDASWINFVNLARNHNIDLRFSIISSTGGPVGPNNTLPTALAPHRVLDPYFWALEFQSQP